MDWVNLAGLGCDIIGAIWLAWGLFLSEDDAMLTYRLHDPTGDDLGFSRTERRTSNRATLVVLLDGEAALVTGQ